MATLKLYLDSRHTKDENTPAPLKIAVNHKGSTAYIPLHINIAPFQFNKDKGQVVRHPNKGQLNTLIISRLNEYNGKLYTLLQSGELRGKNATNIKDMLIHFDDAPERISFRDYFLQFIGEKTKANTISVYTETFKKLERFTKLETLEYEDITPTWLSKFDAYLKDLGMATNSRAINMRNIRAVLNKACDEEIVQVFPFRKFKIQKQETKKRSLTIENLRKLINADLTGVTSYQRDMFVLSFCLIGINSIDLYNLKEIVDGRIEYYRAKTSKKYSIKVEPEAERIINAHKGKNGLVDISDRYKNVLTFTNISCTRLKNIIDGISIYWARHTWATIASELNAPYDLISAALGHNHGEAVTNIYINFNMAKVDDLNRQVLDYVFYDKKP